MSNLVFPMPSSAVIQDREPTDNVITDNSASGKQTSYTWQASQRVKYVVGLSVMRSDPSSLRDYQRLAAFFERHRGPLDTFLFNDPEDNSVSGMCFGVGDGSTRSFQLQRKFEVSQSDNLGGPWGDTSRPRSNNLFYSQNQSLGTAWNASAGVTRTANAAQAPDGTMTATKVVYNGSGSSGQRLFQTTGFNATFDHWITSIWLRADSPCTLTLSCTGGVADAPLVVTVGTTWQRYSLTGTAANGLGIDFQISESSTTPFTLYTWGAQSEPWFWYATQGAIPSRYIVTPSSVAVTSNPVFWPAYSDGFRPITEPSGPFSVFVDGVQKALGTDFTIASGLVTFGSAPTAGAVLTWTGSYFIRCKFSDQSLPSARVVKSAWSGTVNLLSIL